MIVEPMARRPNSDAELDGLLRARGQRATFHRLVIHRAVRMLSHHARAGFMPAVPLPQAPLSDGVVALAGCVPRMRERSSTPHGSGYRSLDEASNPPPRA